MRNYPAIAFNLAGSAVRTTANGTSHAARRACDHMHPRNLAQRARVAVFYASAAMMLAFVGGAGLFERLAQRACGERHARLSKRFD